MREREVELHLRRSVLKMGGLCMKWTGSMGVPDRILILPEGRIIFVEVKTKGGKLSAIQDVVHATLRDHGCDVRVVWTKEEVDQLLIDLSSSSGD